MQILIVHPEARAFAGAERVLQYFLEGAVEAGLQVTVAVAMESRCAEVIPNRCERIFVVDNGKFSFLRLCRQLIVILRHNARRGNRYAVIHGWAARDWELCSLLGRGIGRPAIGTLHDHPEARFISRSRQNLMRWSAKFGLKGIVCVSQAVREACVMAGYPANKAKVVHNGLPPSPGVQPLPKSESFRLGFLGVFAERKGLDLLFEILDELARQKSEEWELHVAGGAQDEAGRQVLDQLKRRFAGREWWQRVQWQGWLENPKSFLASLDLLVFPSSEFDPLPTVLLEAGGLGVPAFAARVGGVSEIIEDNKTGWLFDPSDARQAAVTLGRLVQDPKQCREAGERARRRVQYQFPVSKMVAEYVNIYSTVLSHV